MRNSTLYLLVTVLGGSVALAQPAASPFDAEDPEIAKVRSLDWAHASFESLEEPVRASALVALNRALFDIGAKADARLDLLTDFIDKQELGPAYAQTADTIPAKPAPSFEDMLKVAAAYINSPVAAGRIRDRFADTPPELVKNYVSLYTKSAQREYAETAESRAQVRLMALFLEKQGKLEEFKAWAKVERQRRQDEYQQRVAKDQAKAEQEKEARDARVQSAADERHKKIEEDEQAAARQLAAALQQQQSVSSEGGVVVSNPDDVFVSGWYGTGYYYSNAYRGAVRDRVQNAYNRWQSNRPAQLPSGARPAVRGGGGLRGR